MKRLKRLLSFCLAALLAGGLGLPVGAGAVKEKSFSDIRGHWAKDYIQSGVSQGYLSGYENGTFKPDSAVTRAEFCKMANNALGVTQTASINFKDVSSSDWYYSEVRRAVASGYISGYEDNTFRPNAYITRQEAAVVLSRVVTPPDEDKSIYEFRDGSGIDSWAQSGAGMIYAKSYMAGDDNHNFRPRGSLTRGECAKIVEMLLKGESVVKADVTVSSAQTLSKGLYLGNVTLASGLGNGDVTLKNCRILGTLTVSGGDEIALTHSGVNNLVVNRSGGEPTISASGNSSVRKTTVNSGCQLTESGRAGNGFADVTLTGSSLKNADVELKGTFDNVAISSPSRLNLTSGAITNLTLSSGGAGSQVNLASGTRVTMATIAGAADFTGTGRITSASITASNVTFETPPDNGAGYQTLTPTVTPKNGASEVSVSTKITLAFQETIKTDENRDLTRAYVEDDVVELRAGRENGTTVGFTAALSNSNRTLTLTPDESLDKSTTYYIILLKNSLRNTAGTYNARQVFSFSTVGGLTPVTNPVDGSDTVPVGTNITLTFGDAMVRGDTYASISSEYLNNSCFDLTRGSAGGRSVSFTASISSDKKTVTIDPYDDLDTSTKYYVTLRKNSLANSGRSAVKEQTFSFTTADSSVLVPTMDPPTGSTEVNLRPTLKLTFNEQLYTYDGGSSFSDSYLTDAFTLYRSSNTSSNRVNLNITISSRRVITIEPQENLRANTTYYLELKRNSFSDRSGSSGRNSNLAMTFSFTTNAESTTGSLTPTVMPKNGATGVATAAGPIQLFFDSSLYNSSGGSLSTSYLKNTVLELRESSASGNTVTCNATVDGRVITLTPTGSLRSNTRYYVIVNADTLRNTSSSTSGKTNSKFTSYFTTGSSSAALQASSPHSGATSVGAADSIVLTYGEAVYTNTNDSPSSSYIRSAVKLYEGTSEGSNAVSFGSGTITNSNRTLTLTPNQTLKDNTTYLVVIPAGSFTNSSGVPNTKQSFTFTVGNGISIAMTTPLNNATGVGRMDSIALTFGEAVMRPNGSTPDAAYLAANIYLYQSAVNGTRVTALSYALNNRTITITPTAGTPLNAGTRYYVVIQAGTFAGATRGNNARFEANFTTTSAVLAPTMTPASDATGVPVGTAIVFNFPETAKTANRSDLSAAYVENTAFVVYEGSSGSVLLEDGFTASLDSTSNTRQITLTPKKALKSNTAYRVILQANTLATTGGSLNAAQTFPFRTQTVTPVSAPTMTRVGGSSSIPEALRLTFETGVTQANGTALNAQFIQDNFKLRKGSETGAEQPVTVLPYGDSGLVFTLTPTFPPDPNSSVTIQSLEPGTNYYVTAAANLLKNASGGSSSAVSIPMVTGAPVITITSTPAEKPTGATISFDYQFAFDVVLKGAGDPQLLKSLLPGTPFSSFQVTWAALTPGVTYTLEVQYPYNGGTQVKAQTILIPLPSDNTELDMSNFGVKSGSDLLQPVGSGLEYTLTGVPAGAIDIWAKPAHSKAAATITGPNGSGGAQLPDTIAAGAEQVYTIVVTAEDGFTIKQYKLTVQATPALIP